MWLVNTPSKHETLTQCWYSVGPPSGMLAQHQTSTGSSPHICWAAAPTVHTPTQCLLNVEPASPVLASIHSVLVSTSCWRDYVHIAYTAPMPFKCWPALYTMARYWTNARYSRLYRLCQHDALNQSWVNDGPPSVMLAHIQRDAKQNTVTQYWANVGSAS